MGFRTNPDRILENIDRARERSRDGLLGTDDRQATGRELDTNVPDGDLTNTERAKRVFQAVERAYMKCAQSSELAPVAARFQTIGDIKDHHARGDVSVSIQYLDADRSDDIGVAPFEIVPAELEEARKETKTSRPDVNAMKVMREKLREGVLGAYKKIEPRVREAMRERADLGHLSIQVTIDLRPAG